jgi:hypothetical protein
MYTQDQLRAAFFNASLDWINWRADYEHDGLSNRLPVLTESDRYLRFLRSYRPFKQRTARDAHAAVRDYLLATDTLNHIVVDGSGRTLVSEACSLAEHFPDLGRPVSALSKLAMFAAPELFVPWDSFATEGVRLIDGRVLNYPDYLDRVHSLADGRLGEEIEAVLLLAGPLIPTKNPAFALRVLDSLLMQIGGRVLSGS